MAKPIQKINYNGNKDSKALEQFAVKISKENSKNPVMIVTRFDSAYVLVYKSLSSIPVDSPESRQMLNIYGKVAFVNGKLVNPTSSWQKKQILIDKATND